MHLFADLRYALRRLHRGPGFAAVAVLTLALGIGANTAIFSIVNALLVRSLPFPHAERLVTLEATNPRGSTSIGPEDFRDWQSHSTVFEQMAYTYSSTITMTGFGEPERISGAEVSPGFFPMLGVQPILGRWFLPEEQKLDGRNRVLILSYGLWGRRFGAKPDILGQTVALNGYSYTIIGVMPPKFRFGPGEFWCPLAHGAWGRFVHQYAGFGRLKPGVPLDAAQAQLSAIARRLEQAYPDSNTGWGVRVTPLRDRLIKEFGPALLMSWVAVGVVLLIACANVANLLLARATARTQEIAIRRAVGAARFHLMRLLLSESVLLAASGAALGLLLAQWGVDLAAAAAPPYLDLKSILQIDRNVLAFTLLLSVLTGVLTGLAPALEAARPHAGPRRTRALSAFVVSEVALSLLLLVSAGLLTKSFVRLLGTGLGFRTENVLAVRIELPRNYRDAQKVTAFYEDLTRRIGALPGVVSAGAVNGIPMGSMMAGGAIEVESRPLPKDWTEARATYRIATPNYFRTLDIPLRKGRDFTLQDRRGTEPVAIINDAAVRQSFPHEEPLGRKIRMQPYDKEWRTVVGVVGDVRPAGPEQPVHAEMYLPFSQQPTSQMYLSLRTAVPPSSLAGAVRAEVRALERNAAIIELRTMEQALSDTISPRRHIMTVVDFFGAIALLLAALGLAGVMWYSVSQRTHEIGVRMALGAVDRDVLRLVIGRGLKLALAGIGIGLAAAWGATRLLASLLYGVTPRDPAVFALALLVLLAVALAAGYIPARRAAAVDPVAALRHE